MFTMVCVCRDQALLGQHFDVAACQEMVKRADADKDGKIGFADFKTMMKV